MRIQKIELTNYKAFLGTHKIQVGGRNLFIYGEKPQTIKPPQFIPDLPLRRSYRMPAKEKNLSFIDVA
jgi:hypothetical protein